MRRTTYLLSIALAICGLAAQAQTEAPLLAGIAHVAIRVSNLRSSRDFYQKLGFQEAFTLTKDGVVTESFLKVNDRQFIEIVSTAAVIATDRLYAPLLRERGS